MPNRKTTKRALLGSVLALVLCFAMLLGTTFAWFTDTATTNVNTIQSGTLDVVLEMKDGENWVGAEGQTLDFKKAAGADENEAILWEPGCTYDLPTLRIRNNGNLALKYQVVITGIQGDAELNRAITWTITNTGAEAGGSTEEVPATQTLATVDNNTNNETQAPAAPSYSLAAGQSHELTISGHMQESAGNEYQNKKIDGIAIAVLATQDTVEYDSNDNQYDANAQYPATPNFVTADELESEINDGADITVVGADIPLPKVDANSVTISGAGGTTLKTNKTEITANDVTIKDVTVNGTGASGNDGSLRISGNDTTLENVNYVGESGKIAISVSTGAGNTGTTFKNTKITNAFRGIQFWRLSGNSLIDGCTLDVAGYTFNIDDVESGAMLTVRNSTLKGWTSYTDGISLVAFENCTFGLNRYEYLRPYSTTTLTNCQFNSDGFQLNAGGTTAYTITLTNCTKNGTAITADNVVSLLVDTDDWNTNATLIVNGTTVTVTPTH